MKELFILSEWQIETHVIEPLSAQNCRILSAKRDVHADIRYDGIRYACSEREAVIRSYNRTSIR